MSYKIYIRPTAQKLYGGSAKSNVQHHIYIHDILYALFVGGTSTTWNMAKINFKSLNDIRLHEKIYRRILIGRTDRGVYSPGMLNLGLVARVSVEGRPYSHYRLSPHGILYCMDTFDPTRREIKKVVKHYEFLLPKIFGRWKLLEQILGSDIHGLRILAKGMYLINLLLARPDSPLYELMSFIHVKYRRFLESIEESDLVEQISYWFYTFLLYDNVENLKKILAQDSELREWYSDFYRQAMDHYAQRLRAIKNSAHLFDF